MKLLKLLALTTLLFSSAVLAETKIAVVDLREAIMQSDEARLKYEKLKASLSQEEADAIALRNQIQKMDEKRQKDAAVMGQGELRKLEKDIEDKKIELNFKGQKLQKSGKDATQELLASMAPKVERALAALVEEKKYDLVLHREAAPWSDPKLDITKELIQKINTLK